MASQVVIAHICWVPQCSKIYAANNIKQAVCNMAHQITRVLNILQYLQARAFNLVQL